MFSRAMYSTTCISHSHLLLLLLLYLLLLVAIAVPRTCKTLLTAVISVALATLELRLDEALDHHGVLQTRRLDRSLVVGKLFARESSLKNE